MSYENGMAALRLEMPSRIPRTEYSADNHWKLVSAVTGLEVSVSSDSQLRFEASKKFMEAWNYDFIWSILISRGELGSTRTKMGHAVYAEGGTDYDEEVSCLFTSHEEVFAFDFEERLGIGDIAEITTRFNSHYEQAAQRFPSAVNMTGIYITCISGLIDLLGWDMLLTAAGEDIARFSDFTKRYIKWIEPYFIALAKSTPAVVMVHDDIAWTSGPFIHPSWYREFVFPNYAKLFDYLKQAGKIICFTSDGDYTMFIDDIARCGINCFVMEPMTDMAYIAEKYGRTHSFVGNADTRILLYGNKDDIAQEVKRCIDIGKNCPGFFMAVGNHIPSNTPVDNVLYYNECYEKMSLR